MNNVILIGMPGCGKSTVAQVYGRKYAEMTRDTDEVIVKEYGEISKIFAEHGEEYFRNIETEVLKHVCAEKDCFISVGGGCVLREENVRIMKTDGNKVVYLRTKLSTLEARLQADTSRPLLQGDLKERLNRLYTERKEIYERVADITVDTDGLTPEEIFENILIALRGSI
ncbi:MAG: shikimate kinase [Clostridia bacterium]|nr:shikimate kinase [Clostridia bacterium]